MGATGRSPCCFEFACIADVFMLVLRIGFTKKVLGVVNARGRGIRFANSISRAEVYRVAELVARDAGSALKELDFLRGGRSMEKSGRAHRAYLTNRDRLAMGDNARVSGLLITGLISILCGPLYV